MARKTFSASVPIGIPLTLFGKFGWLATKKHVQYVKIKEGYDGKARENDHSKQNIGVKRGQRCLCSHTSKKTNLKSCCLLRANVGIIYKANLWGPGGLGLQKPTPWLVSAEFLLIFKSLGFPIPTKALDKQFSHWACDCSVCFKFLNVCSIYRLMV